MEAPAPPDSEPHMYRSVIDIAGHAGIGGIQNEDADLFPIP